MHATKFAHVPSKSTWLQRGFVHAHGAAAVRGRSPEQQGWHECDPQMQFLVCALANLAIAIESIAMTAVACIILL